MKNEVDSIIVGGGIAGLAAALKLSAAGFTCRILEGSDRVGGRVATDNVNGFLLDRGFQVFLTAYPEARTLLNYDALNLCPFEPGALVRFRGRFRRLSDPWRRPQHLLATAMSPIASLADKLRIAHFRRDTSRGSLSDLYQRPEKSTLQLLRDRGFSDVIIERFFRPFLGGVFLEGDLQTTSRMCEFVFRMFSMGDAALPAMGMGEIPYQMAKSLPPSVVQTECFVKAIEGNSVETSKGEVLTAKSTIIATSAPSARELLGTSLPSPGTSRDIIGNGVTCLYFSADSPPIEEPILLLNGDGEGPINNLCVPSQVSKHYAPPNKSLVSITVLGVHSSADIVEQVRSQIRAWFGPQTDSWNHLKTYLIPYALPKQTPSANSEPNDSCVIREGVYVCGDHCDTASINGAMASGRRAADSAISFLESNVSRPSRSS